MNDAQRLGLDVPQMPEGLLDDRIYDRQGNKITLGEWGALRKHRDEDGKQYPVVKQEDVGNYWVSTVWLGMDNGLCYDESAPVIFETKVFPRKGDDVPDWGELAMNRYYTEQEAVAGHARMVEAVRAWQ